MVLFAERQYERIERATAGLDAPTAVLDLDAYDANAADLVRRANGRPIRVASKSIRVRSLLSDLQRTSGFAGVLAYTLPEALWLATDFPDVVVGYPTADRGALSELARDERAAARVTVMIDSTDHLDFIDAVAPPGGREEIRVCLEVDASWRLAGGRIHLGVRRSTVYSPREAWILAKAVQERRGFRLVGIMMYEAQIAGLGDAPAGRVARGLAVRAMQRSSARELAARRAAVVRAVSTVSDLEFVNGGGTGSLERTAAERAVTEVAAGSGLFGPTLFDSYRSFHPRPAALFALPVVRRPAPRIATVQGGGWIASGIAHRDRLPRPTYPAGLALSAQEGAGEVQTPVIGPAAQGLAVGDKVWFRHAKAGELCEHIDVLHLVRGSDVVGTVPTYRGEGQVF